jgi:hypothetical protein
MWDANTRTLKSFFLAAAMVVIAGCESGAAPRQAPNVVSELKLPGARHQVDAARNRVWYLTAEGVYLFDVSRPDRVAVHLPGWVWAGAPYGCLPDLALGPRGEAVVTSNVIPVVWRIDPESLAVTEHALALDADTDRDVGFTGLVFSPQHGVYFAVSDVQGSLWRIDAQLKTAQKMPLSASIPQACGLVLSPRSTLQSLNRMADLCVDTPHGGWSVLLAPGRRSSYVSAAPCAVRSVPSS